MFDLAGLETLRQALQLYRTILGAKKRRWAGEGKRYAVAFSAFGHGIYSEFSRRAAFEGEERALAALEQKRLSIVAGAAANCRRCATRITKLTRLN